MNSVIMRDEQIRKTQAANPDRVSKLQKHLRGLQNRKWNTTSLSTLASGPGKMQESVGIYSGYDF